MTPPLRIDAHQHFWSYSKEAYPWIDESMAVIARDFGPEDLHPHLRAAKIDGCIAVQARQHEGENGYLLGLAERHSWILGVVGWLDLTSSDLPRRLDEAALRPRLVGFREILQGGPDRKFLNDAFVRGLRLLGERGYAYDVLIHSSQLEAAARLIAQARPDQTLILDHLGKPDIRGGELDTWAVRIKTLARDHPNLHCKLSGMVTEAPADWSRRTLQPYMEVVLEAFGPRRLLYGSDWPVCLLNAPGYARVHDVARDFVNGLGETAAADIFGGNAARLYRIPTAPV